MRFAKRLVWRILRRLARYMPAPMVERAKAVLTTRRFAVNTAGIVEDPRWRAWTAENGRPVTIVIPSYNDYEMLRDCLESIERTAKHLDYNVIVIDDYAQPANAQRLRSLESQRVRVVLKPERSGFAKSVNMGMALVPKDRDIVILNSDIVALPGWLDALQGSAYAIDPKIGMVSARLLYPNGTIQYGGTYYARVLAPQWFGHLYVGHRPNPLGMTAVPWYNRSVSGACTYVTRSAYEKVGGLHEGFWLGFEDVDYGLTAWEKGIRAYYQPAAGAIHHESASRGYSQGPRELSSMRLFWRRWEEQFMRRRLDGELAVDFVITVKADAAWRRYVGELADRLNEAGVPARVWNTLAGEVDEELVEKLAPVSSIKVCCDWGAQQTTWLASLHAGKPIYLLPSIETLPYSNDPELQARIIAGYRPEFDYVAPNRWTASAVTAETAWEVQYRVVPALQPPSPVITEDKAVIIGGTEDERATVAAVARARGLEAVEIVDPQASDAAFVTLVESHPKVVVSFVGFDSSIVPLFCMSIGAVYVGLDNPQTKYEVFDGYNAMTFAPAQPEKAAVLLNDVLGDPVVLDELRENGMRTATHLYERNTRDIIEAFENTARTAV